MAHTKITQRNPRWVHLESRLVEQMQEVINIVVANEDDIVTENTRLRNERDAAREESIALKDDLKNLALTTRREAATRATAEQEITALRDEILKLKTGLQDAIFKHEASQRDLKRSRELLHLAEDGKEAALVERQRAIEDCAGLRMRNEQLQEKLRVALFAQSPEKAQAHRQPRRQTSHYPTRRSSSERDWTPSGQHYAGYSQQHSNARSRYSGSAVVSRSHGESSNSVKYHQNRPGSPRGGGGIDWYPPSPRQTTSHASPHHKPRASPVKASTRTNRRPSFTHVRSSGTITVAVPLEPEIKQEDDDGLLSMDTPVTYEEGTKRRPNGRMKSARVREEEAEYVEDDDMGRGDYGSDELAIGQNNDEVEDEDEISGWHEDEGSVVQRQPSVRRSGTKRKATAALASAPATKRRTR